MQKCILTGIVLCFITNTQAQLNVSTKNFELESVNKHKNWKIIEAGVEKNTQKTFVKFASPSCDIDKSVGATTVTTTFNGLRWSVDKLYFDNQFNYLSSDSKNYLNTKEAILSNELVYGKKFNVIVGDGLGTLLKGVAMPTGPIDNSYLFTNIVTGFGGIGGFKIGTSYLGVKVGGNVSKFGPDQCLENAAAFKQSNIDAKEEKGQLWIPMFNHPVPNGGHILFNTGYVNPDPTKTHNVFRRYDGNATIIKEKALTFDYQCILYAKEIELAPGKFDYVFVTTPINYKKSTGKLVPPNQYEYIRIDGSTFETKDQITINAPHSLWKINQVFEKNGEVYLLGDAGKSAETYADFSIPKASDYPNFQIAKIANGKLVYISLITEDKIKAALASVSGDKVKAEMNFRVVDLQMDAVNGKFIYSGQQIDGAERVEAIINAVFNESGQLEIFMVKETEYSKGNLVFSKDNKTMHWLIQDVTEYNKWDKKSGIITAKESKQVLTALSVVSYNLDNKSMKFETLMNQEWGAMFSNTILYDNEDEVVILGGKLTKKAKESEVVFVSIKK